MPAKTIKALKALVLRKQFGAPELVAALRVLGASAGATSYVIQAGKPRRRQPLFNGNLSIAHRPTLQNAMKSRLDASYGKRGQDYVLTVLATSEE